MMRGITRRGQPLAALVLLLGAWVSARAVMWEPHSGSRISGIAAIPDRGEAVPPRAARHGPAPMSLPRNGALIDALPVASADAGPAMPYEPLSPAMVRPAPPPVPRSDPVRLAPAPLQAPPPAPAFAPVPARVAAGHHLLWMAALARVPMPAALGMSPASAPLDQRLVPAGAPAAPAGIRRWSADGWVLWRRGSVGGATGGLLTPSYGASQAGAVVRYRLAPASALRPAAYLRTTAALNGSSEREAALGLQLRPIAGVPIALLGEARLTAVPGRTHVRPAVFAVTEIAPFALPLGLRGELYGQGGYVGGANATAFADGQLRLDRRLAALGRGDLRLGGGLWGGAQKGASRLDAGPTLSIGQPLGQSGSMRLAADWRFRVAGKAAPGSGPAVTLSAGF